MQRLFSTFPGSWPGFGLLILRLTVGVAPLVGMVDLASFPEPSLLLGLAPLIALFLSLLAGFATPVVCFLQVLALLALGRNLTASSWLIVAGGSASLMMLGPGAWSVDACLYGRKRIRIGEQ